MHRSCIQTLLGHRLGPIRCPIANRCHVGPGPRSLILRLIAALLRHSPLPTNPGPNSCLGRISAQRLSWNFTRTRALTSFFGPTNQIQNIATDARIKHTVSGTSFAYHFRYRLVQKALYNHAYIIPIFSCNRASEDFLWITL